MENESINSPSLAVAITTIREENVESDVKVLCYLVIDVLCL